MGQAPDDDNALIIALMDEALDLMKARDVAQILWMLVSSERIDEDLDVALRHPERWSQSVVLRRWWPGVASDLEFRLFVHEGVATGLTQYNQFLFSERIATRREAIGKALVAFYEAEVRPRLKGTSFYEDVNGRFTCDLAIDPAALSMLDSSSTSGMAVQLDTKSVKLVELNCFYEATGMGLFDYHADQEALTKGPFECRVRTSPLPRAAVKLESEWRGVLTGARTKDERSARHLTDGVWEQLKAALQC